MEAHDQQKSYINVVVANQNVAEAAIGKRKRMTRNKLKKKKRHEDQSVDTLLSKGYLHSRCAVQNFSLLVSSFTEEKKEIIKSLGFGGLLHVPIRQLRNKLIEELVERFDISTSELCVHGCKLKLDLLDVGRITGLSSEGRDIYDLQEFVGEDVRQKYKLNDGLIRLKDLCVELESLEANEEFKAKFFLYALSSFVNPSTGVTVREMELRLLNHLSDVASFNWAKYAFAGLINGVSKYQSTRHSSGKPKWISGCIFILEIFYLEHISVEVPSLNIGLRDCPSMQRWNENLVSKVLYKVGRLGGVDSDTVQVVNVHNNSCSSCSDLKKEIVEIKNDLKDFKSEVIFILKKYGEQMKEYGEALRQYGEKMSSYFNGPRKPVDLNPKDDIPKDDDKVGNNSEITNVSPMFKDMQEGGAISRKERGIQLSDSQTKLASLIACYNKKKRKNDYSTEFDAMGSPVNIRNDDSKVVGTTVTNVGVKDVSSLTSSLVVDALPEHCSRVFELGTMRGTDEFIKSNVQQESYLCLSRTKIKKSKGIIVCPRLQDNNDTKDLTSSTFSELLKQVPNFAWDHKLNPSDILCETRNEFATRKSFISLKGRHWVSSEIINVVADLLTEKELAKHDGRKYWFLPCHFSTRVLQISRPPLSTFGRSYVGDNLYMKDLSSCDKIFLPIYDPNIQHWFLAVFNLKDWVAYIIDSCYSLSTIDRETILQRLAEFFDEFFCLPVFHKEELGINLDFSSFEIKRMNVCQQNNGFDCGVYVVHYMRTALEDLNVQGISSELPPNARSEIASWLILHESNKTRTKSIFDARKYYKGKKTTL